VTDVQDPVQEEEEEALQEGESADAGGEEEVFPLELVVERTGAGQWAVWDSRVGEWENVGKETEAIANARARATGQEEPARMRVIGSSGGERKVKYTRTYNVPGKKGPGRPKKEKAQQGAPRPPLPGEEAPAAPATVHVPEPTPAAPAASAPAPAPSWNVTVGGGDGASASAGRTLQLMLLTTADEHVVAIDADAVDVVEPSGTEGYVYVHIGARTYVVPGGLLDVVRAINANRGR